MEFLVFGVPGDPDEVPLRVLGSVADVVQTPKHDRDGGITPGEQRVEGVQADVDRSGVDGLDGRADGLHRDSHFSERGVKPLAVAPS